MGKKSPAQVLAEEWSDQVRDTLHRLGQWIYPDTHTIAGTPPQWESSFRELVDLPLRGDWILHGKWRYVSVPSSDEAHLHESSVGLTVAHHKVAGYPTTVCIVRYDLDQARGRHLNIFQPHIEDRVHWVALGSELLDAWPLRECLEFLLGPAISELTGAGWPPA